MSKLGDKNQGSNVSKMEMTVRRVLQQGRPDLKYVYSARDVIDPFEIDIYLPDLKLGIEVSGVYFHEMYEQREAERGNESPHRRKLARAREEGVEIYVVWDTDLKKDFMGEMKKLAQKITDKENERK